MKGAKKALRPDPSTQEYKRENLRRNEKETKVGGQRGATGKGEAA